MDLVKKYRYSGKRKFNIEKFDQTETGKFKDREEAVDEFVNNLKMINKLQQKLYAERKEGVVFVFQAMDAAGKDGVIRTVFSTLSPHGVKEFCFKVPSAEEQSHDYLWRFWSALPARGNISIFNRSYYEDVLVGKVHKLYENMTVPDRVKQQDIIEARYEQIKDYENYLYNTGTRVVKIFLNVSKDEQARRFIARIDTPKKNWKVSSGDIRERAYWDDYMEAFEKMVNKTSTANAPWYVVPADHKWYERLIVSRIVLQTLMDIDPQYPVIDNETFDNIDEIRQNLVDSMESKDLTVEDSGEFSNTGAISGDIVYEEELEKILEKRSGIKNEGFKKVRDLIAKGYIVKGDTTVAEALFCDEEDDFEDEEELIEDVPAEEVPQEAEAEAVVE